VVDWIARNFGKCVALLILAIALCLWRVRVEQDREQAREQRRAVAARCARLAPSSRSPIACAAPASLHATTRTAIRAAAGIRRLPR
jgi:hypothetical protein